MRTTPAADRCVRARASQLPGFGPDVGDESVVAVAARAELDERVDSVRRLIERRAVTAQPRRRLVNVPVEPGTRGGGRRGRVSGATRSSQQSLEPPAQPL
jgi:hypothetical protein